MAWKVLFHPKFAPEFEALAQAVQDELLSAVEFVVENGGPAVGRPHVDTLTGSKHANLKELRFNADKGVWRVFFAFDPNRQSVILVAGNKTGISESRFYKGLIRVADERFDEHLVMLSTGGYDP